MIMKNIFRQKGTKVDKLPRASIMNRLRARFGPDKSARMDVDDRHRFEQKYKKEMPVRYFFLEKLPDVLFDMWMCIVRPVKNLKYQIIWRTVDKYHVVNTGLKPGYYDKDYIMLHANFALLVDFVECENASPSNEGVEKWKSRLIPFYNYRYRSAERGVASLRCQIQGLRSEIEEDELIHGHTSGSVESMKSQLQKTESVLDLYLWWTETRPKQLEELEAMDTTKDFYDAIDKEGMGSLALFSNDLRAKYPSEFNAMMKSVERKKELQDIFNQEEQEKLIELIELRSFLWT